MKICDVRLFPARIPRKYPFKTSMSIQHSVNGVFIEMKSTDGNIGTGEAAPRQHITGETLENTFQELQDLSEEIIGQNIDVTMDIIHQPESYGPAARIGTEMALFDIISQKKNIPICDFLGMNERKKVSYCSFIGSDDHGERLVRKARKLKEKGYQIVRMKVGELDFSADYERVKTLREITGDGIGIWLDVNQAWRRDEAVDHINQLEKFNLLMVEQPLDRYDYKGHKLVRENVNVPIMLDESIQNYQDLENVIELKCADAVNLKFMKLGSFFETRKLIKRADEANLQSYCGGTTVTDIFAMYARHVEFALPKLHYFSSGVPRSGVFAENPTEPKMVFSPKEPYSTRPTRSGLGIKLQHDIFDRYVIN